jgi:hypothetical protein
MTSAIYTPLDFSDAVKVGRRRFWKQILPVTEIDYDGQKVKFDNNFHKQLSLAYEDGVYDQVPLVFADGANTHNEDPRNFGGEIVHMENRGKDGTWALIEADREASKAIRKNPRLGVSARIRQGVEKDGKTYGAAVRHVLMTMFPRVKGMSPWQAVDLSDNDSDIEVVDLTAETYNQEGSVMGKTKTTSTGTIDLSRLSDEQFQSLLDLSTAALADPEEEVEEGEEGEEEEVEEKPEARKVRRKKSKTKVTIEKDTENDDPDDDDEYVDELDEDEEQDLSDAEHVSGREALTRVKKVQIDLADQRWKHEREGYLNAGVPAFMLDLAEPVLKQPEAVTLDLSDDESINATKIIREMLDGAKGVVDLTGELGHAIDLSSDPADATQEFLDAWDEQYG